jgi:hypothetical protein
MRGFRPEHLTTLKKIYLSRWNPFGADFAGKPDMPRKAPRKAAGERLEFWYLGSDFRFKHMESLPGGSKNSMIYRFVKYVDNIPAK